MKDCRNCNWAKWVMTNHNPPRINTRTYGKCEYVVALPVLPAVVEHSQLPSQNGFNSPGYRTIWANKAYTDCATYEPQEDSKGGK